MPLAARNVDEGVRSNHLGRESTILLILERKEVSRRCWTNGETLHHSAKGTTRARPATLLQIFAEEGVVKVSRRGCGRGAALDLRRVRRDEVRPLLDGGVDSAGFGNSGRRQGSRRRNTANDVLNSTNECDV